MCPSGRHFGHALISKLEMVRLLIIFDSSRGENGMPLSRIVSKFAGGGRLEIVGVLAQVVVSTYLIKCILIAKELILCKISWIRLDLEAFELFGTEILTPAS